MTDRPEGSTDETLEPATDVAADDDGARGRAGAEPSPSRRPSPSRSLRPSRSPSRARAGARAEPEPEPKPSPSRAGPTSPTTSRRRTDDDRATTKPRTRRRRGRGARPTAGRRRCGRRCRAAARQRGQPAATTRAPTPSELAVRVTDNASRIFVIATVVVFVGILLNGILFGTRRPHHRDRRRRSPTAVATASPSVVGIAQLVGVAERLGLGRAVGLAPSASASARPSAAPARPPRRRPHRAPRPARPEPRRRGRILAAWTARRPSETDDRVRRARERMVAASCARRGIHDERVLDADGRGPARAVRRRRRPARRAYADEALPIDAGQTISQPFIVARMTELLATRPGRPVLEIGTGSGLPGGDPRRARLPT